MKTIQKYYPLILAIIVILIACRIITNIKHNQNTTNAVAQSEINRLAWENSQLLKDTTALHDQNRSLQADNSYLISALSASEAKRSQIALKLEIEHSKLSKESDSGTVRRFLNETGYKSLLVQKYDSLYMVPASSAKQSNIERASLSAAVSDNSELIKQSDMKGVVIKNLSTVVDNKDKEITILSGVIHNHLEIESALKSQVKAEHRKYVGQRVKTWIVGGVGVAILTGVILIVK